MAVQYLSGQMRVTGLTENGADFETMIDKLKSIEMMQANKLAAWKLDWQERQEAFRTVRAQLQSMRTTLNEINSIDKFMVKTTASSNSSVATATAKSGALAGAADEIEVGQLATSAVWSIATGATEISDSINDSGATQTFSYEYAGKTRTINVPPGTTLDGFRNLVNKDTKNLGITANLVRSGSSYTLQVKGNKTGSENEMKILFTDVDGLSGGAYPPYSGKYATTHTTAADVVNTTGSAKNFKYTYGGQEHSLSLAAGATLQDFADAINNDPNKPAGVAANLVTETDGTMSLQLTAADGNPVDLVANSNLTGIDIAAGPTVESPAATGWHAQASQDAKVRINGWPMGDWIVKSDNTADDIIPGVSVTFKDIGKTTISVETDTQAIADNVVKFIDSINEFRTLIQDMTKLDPSKNTLSPEYANSLYEMQEGSILTGNYGVQLLSSQIKQATAGMPPGFRAMLEADGNMTGDMFTSLSQIGVKTNADGSGGETFGLLVLNDDDKLPMLDDILQQNPMAVAEFFAANNLGVSDSSDFSFSDSLASITRPGSFDVNYDIVGGNIQNATINGKDAKVNPDGTLSLIRSDPTSTDTGVATATSDGRFDYEYEVEIQNVATTSSTLIETEFASRTEPLHTDAGSEYVFEYTFGTQTKRISIPAEPQFTTLDDLVRTINRDKGNPGVTASVALTNDTPPKYNMRLQAKASGATNPIYVSTDPNLAGMYGKDQAPVEGQDAVYRYRPVGGSTWTNATSSTNTVSLAPGLTMKMHGPQPGVVNPGDPWKSTTIKAVKHNDADGIIVKVDNMADGSYDGTVRIRQGKINEMLELLNGKPGKAEEGMLGSKGALQILDDNYNGIIKGINAKLEREDARIIKWERLIRERFARLEATLQSYESLEKTIESQIKQLNTNSGS